MLHPCGKPGPQDELKMQAQPNKQELFDLLIQAKRTEAYTPFPGQTYKTHGAYITLLCTRA
jgi:hypothetical protein